MCSSSVPTAVFTHTSQGEFPQHKKEGPLGAGAATIANGARPPTEADRNWRKKPPLARRPAAGGRTGSGVPSRPPASAWGQSYTWAARHLRRSSGSTLAAGRDAPLGVETHP